MIACNHKSLWQWALWWEILCKQHFITAARQLSCHHNKYIFYLFIYLLFGMYLWYASSFHHVSWVQPSSDRNEGWHDSDRQCFILKHHIYMRSAAAPAVADSVSPWFSVQIERTGRISGLQSTVCGLSAGKEAKFFRVNLYQCLNSAWSADAPKKCCLFERHEVLWRPEIAPVR